MILGQRERGLDIDQFRLGRLKTRVSRKSCRMGFGFGLFMVIKSLYCKEKKKKDYFINFTCVILLIFVIIIHVIYHRL